jgi:DNA repair exonuclease SbcCD ATPase subunit
LIIFRNLRYKNILSTGNTFTELSLDKHSTTLITGNNGGGKCLEKTTLVNVLSEDKDVETKLKKFTDAKTSEAIIECTIKDIVDFYDEYPEYIGKLKVNSRFGYKTIEYADVTAIDSQIMEVITESGRSIKTSPEHKLFDVNVGWTFTKDLTNQNVLLCENGTDKVVSVNLLSYTEDLYDLQVSEVKEFYANGIVSHNSTILDSICFALYGRPYRRINKPNLVNSINKKDLLVEIEFDIGSIKYKVVRGMKPSIFKIYKNGKLLDESAASKDYQSILEEQILKINFKTFCQIIIQGSSTAVPFMQLTAQNRREVVEDLLDLEVFSVMNVLLKEKVSSNNKEILETEYQIDLISEKIKMQREHSAALKDTIRDQISNNEEQYTDNASTITKYQGEIASVQNIVSDLRNTIDNTIDKRISGVEKIQLQLNNKMKTIQKEYKFFHDNEQCPTCQQKIDATFKAEMIDEKQKQQKSLDHGLNELDTKLLGLIEKQNEVKKINDLISDYNMEVFKYQNTIETLQKQNQKILQDTRQLQEKLNVYDNDEDSAKFQESLTEYEKRKEALLELRDNYTIVSHILKDKGIKSRILNQYIPVINKLINKYLSNMEFYVEFHLDSNFNETIKSRFRDDFSYMNFSEGEKNRIDLAILLTWRAIAKMRNSAAANLLILDEALESGLDIYGVEYLLGIIQSELSNTNTILISHNDSVRDRFDHVIQFTKVNNFSRVK